MKNEIYISLKLCSLKTHMGVFISLLWYAAGFNSAKRSSSNFSYLSVNCTESGYSHFRK